ncbi:MAG: molybdate ABC transporter substrate-binding protein [Cetobacterium sp.]
MKLFLFIFFIVFQYNFSNEILISGASSLKEYLEKNIVLYKKQNPQLDIILNLGGSGTLKKQLERGGDVDIIFLANRNYMIDLKNNNYIFDEHVLLRNSLALIKNKNSDGNILAIGDPKYVPAGIYASEVLKALPTNNYSLVYGKDVRSVLSYVELGEADFGIVYKTDIKLLKNSTVVEIFNEKYHTPIEYSVGVSTSTKNKIDSENFIKFLKEHDWND